MCKTHRRQHSNSEKVRNVLEGKVTYPGSVVSFPEYGLTPLSSPAQPWTSLPPTVSDTHFPSGMLATKSFRPIFFQIGSPEQADTLHFVPVCHGWEKRRRRLGEKEKGPDPVDQHSRRRESNRLSTFTARETDTDLSLSWKDASLIGNRNIMRIASYSLLRGCGRLVACQRSPGNCPTSLAYTSRKFSVQKRNEDDSSKDSVEKTGDYNTNVAMRKPNAFEKFVLVYTKRYARKDQIPEYVPHTQILMANDKFRGRMLIRFMLLGFLDLGDQLGTPEGNALPLASLSTINAISISTPF
ncbi:unnamed protein product [Cyprideis torosa]|uniref:Uncharacterized protein n=1 Tax=Cyprideis torosa TaxID=163714 RepID=A0A7R8WMC2_9CRUS|nr:unnamed protein product [Cyprideis torosa]CAG0898307.1 unnamed protein product [Cyprideis torosa]